MVKAEIYNFKNVECGIVPFANYTSAHKRATIDKIDIEGVYGQNGSGKTALVEALGIMRDIMAGQAISAKTYSELVDPDGKTCLCITFFIEKNKKKYLAVYEVNIISSPENEYLSLFEEHLSYYTRGATWKGKRELIVKNTYYDLNNILEQNNASIEQVPVAAFDDVPLLSQPEKLLLIGSQKSTSVFFSNILEKQFSSMDKLEGDVLDLRNIIVELRNFAQVNFCVVKVNQLGAINLKTFLPLMIHQKTKNTIRRANFKMSSINENVIDEQSYEFLQNALPSLNIALSALIPNLSIEFRETERTVQNDKNFVHVSIEAVRNGKHFSIRYESEGIQRIISLLSYLIALYNDPEICLVIDEFDDGIFEYLLGELIGVLGKEARGQLIFTSHNLRVLEKLDYKHILCTTTNPKNRYIHLSGVGANNNKRDFYIRSIVIGGQKEELYDAADLEDIGATFQRAYAYSSDDVDIEKRNSRLNKLQLAINLAKEEAKHE